MEIKIEKQFTLENQVSSQSFSLSNFRTLEKVVPKILQMHIEGVLLATNV